MVSRKLGKGWNKNGLFSLVCCAEMRGKTIQGVAASEISKHRMTPTSLGSRFPRFFQGHSTLFLLHSACLNPKRQKRVGTPIVGIRPLSSFCDAVALTRVVKDRF